MYEIPVDKRTFEGKGYLKRFWTNLSENAHNPAPPCSLYYAGIRMGQRRFELVSTNGLLRRLVKLHFFGRTARTITVLCYLPVPFKPLAPCMQ